MSCAKHIAIKTFFTAPLVIFKSWKSSKCQPWVLGCGDSSAWQPVGVGSRKSSGIETPALPFTPCATSGKILPLNLFPYALKVNRDSI